MYFMHEREEEKNANINFIFKLDNWHLIIFIWITD